MRKSFVIICAKLIWRIGRVFGHGGTALPGLVAEKLDPHILPKLAKNNFSSGLVLITGSNGKTTVASLLTQLLKAQGYKVIYNKGGSNLSRGLISCMIQNATLTGKISEDMAVFEIDENAFTATALQLNPTDVVITNLFRDQLDRYGEVDMTATKLASTLKHLYSTYLYLNSDDPRVAFLGKKKKRVTYFGVADGPETKLDDQWSADIVTNPTSKGVLRYKKRYYSHLGIYYSSNDEFNRPQPDLAATKLIFNDKTLAFNLQYNHKTVKFTAPYGGFYNTYNVLAALGVVQRFKMPADLAQQVVAKAQPAFGRMEEITYNNQNLKLLLVKNPAGFNQIIETYVLPNVNNPLLICINDNLADGRDVSWLWDVYFEALRQHKGSIVVSGQRAYDMALRLKYANVVNFTIKLDIQDALQDIMKQNKNQKTIYILPTYTAMFQLRQFLAKKTKLAEFWQ